MSSQLAEGGLTDQPKDLQCLVPGAGHPLLTRTCRRGTPWIDAELKELQRSSRPSHFTHRETEVQRGQGDGANLHGWLVVGQDQHRASLPLLGSRLAPWSAKAGAERNLPPRPGFSLILALVPSSASGSLAGTHWIPGPWSESSPFPTDGLQASGN